MLVDCFVAVGGKEMEKKGMKGVRLGCCGEEKRGKREWRYSTAVAASGCGVGGAPVVLEEKDEEGEAVVIDRSQWWYPTKGKGERGRSGVCF
ncbi:hypothetical protein HAX54_011990, partial [Datura stramonium]|nr:hypothetical protein [Datura stramonium]